MLSTKAGTYKALLWRGSGQGFMPGVWTLCYRKPWQGQEAYILMKEQGEPLSQYRHSIASLFSIASGRSQWNLCPGNVTSASQRLPQQLKETINKQICTESRRCARYRDKYLTGLEEGLILMGGVSFRHLGLTVHISIWRAHVLSSQN